MTNVAANKDDALPLPEGSTRAETAPRTRDWVFTPFFLAVFVLLLLVFDPLQRLARLFGPRPHETLVAVLQSSLKLALRVCGTRFEVERSPAVEPGKPYLFVANHQSMFDIPILAGLLFTNHLKYVSKRELARWIPSISYNLRRGGHAIIDRGDRESALRVIRDFGLRVAERGVSAVIYPEGTRARAGVLKPFKPAGTLEMLAAAPAHPVVPVAIDGSWKLLRHRMRPVPFGTRVRVRICEPIERSSAEDREGILRRVESEVRDTLRGWRLSVPP